MKQQFHELAKSLDLHPFNLLIHFAEVNANFEEIWPDVDEKWADYIKAKCGKGFAKDSNSLTVNKDNEIDIDDQLDYHINEDEKIILQWLSSKGKWAGAYTHADALKKFTHLSPKDLGHALRSLQTKGLLIEHGIGKFSLNSKKKNDIEAIIQHQRIKKTQDSKQS
jgi:hypothetical protein